MTRDKTPYLRFDTTSTDRQIRKLAYALVDEYLSKQRKPSTKDLAEYRQSSLTVVAGLLLAESYQGGTVRFSNNKSPYSGRHRTEKARKLLTFMVANGYLEKTENHSFDPKRKTGNKASKYRPTQRWTELVQRHPLPGLSTIVRRPDAPVIVVRDEKKQTLGLKQHSDRREWDKLVKTYNAKLTEHQISLDGKALSSVTFSLRRMFSNGSYDANGRFYSDIQNRNPKERYRLLIDGEAVAEVDYRATHPWLLYQSIGLAYPGDPYDIEGLDRKSTKWAFNVMLNSSQADTAEALRWEMVKQDRRDRRKRKDRTRPDYEQFMAKAQTLDRAIRAAHAPIAHYFGTRAGLWLMRFDSDIVESVLRYMMDAGVLVIPIHDSFLVPYSGLEILSAAMAHGETFAAEKRGIVQQPSAVEVSWHRPNSVIQAEAHRVFGPGSYELDNDAQRDAERDAFADIDNETGFGAETGIDGENDEEE